MDRVGAVASFALITALSMLGLRGAHLLIGIAYPPSLPGPFELTSLEDVERHTGFSPHIPFYRPMSLGAAPVAIVAERRPVPKIRVLWHGDALLELIEWRGGDQPPTPESARPLPGHDEVLHWKSDGESVAVLPVADRWLTIRTSLDLTELRRIVETLLPYNRLI